MKNPRAHTIGIILEKVSDVCRSIQRFHSVNDLYVPMMRCMFHLVSLKAGAISGGGDNSSKRET